MEGGRVWQGVCMVGVGVGMAGGMRGRVGGMYGVGGYAWQGVCVAQGLCMAGGHVWKGMCVWFGGVHVRGVCMPWQIPWDTVNDWAVRILLECILVIRNSGTLITLN